MVTVLPYVTSSHDRHVGSLDDSKFEYEAVVFQWYPPVSGRVSWILVNGTWSSRQFGSNDACCDM